MASHAFGWTVYIHVVENERVLCSYYILVCYVARILVPGVPLQESFFPNLECAVQCFSCLNFYLWRHCSSLKQFSCYMYV